MVYSAVAARDFGNSAIGGTNYLQAIAGLNMSYSIAERWSGSAGISYEFAEYHESVRVDKFWTANLGLNYSPHRFVSMSAGYVFLTNESTVDIANFDSTARY
jgi:long-subunit fatty acid transport protein